MMRLQQTAGNRAVESLITRDAGEPLPARDRATLEPLIGVESRAVRIHAGPEAGAVAERLGARALTLGRHVVFGRDEYRPGDPAGRRLLAHELAHVAQSATSRGVPSTAAARRAAESQAERVAGRAVRGEPAAEAPVGAEGVLLSPVDEEQELASEEQLIRAFARVRQGVFASPGQMARMLEQWHAAGLLDPPHRPAEVNPIDPVPAPDQIPYSDRTRAQGVEDLNEMFGTDAAGASMAMMGEPGLGGPPPLPFPGMWRTPRPPTGAGRPISVPRPGPSPGPGAGPGYSPRAPTNLPILQIGIPAAIAAAPFIADWLGRTLSPESYPPNWEAMTNPITGAPIAHLEELVWLRELSAPQIAYLRSLFENHPPRVDPQPVVPQQTPGPPGPAIAEPQLGQRPEVTEPSPAPPELRDPEASWEPRLAAGVDVKQWRWRGRVRNLQSVPAVQAGHRTSAFRLRETGELDRLALEDADFNQVASNTMESSGIFAERESIVIAGAIIDRATAQMLARDPEFPGLTPEMVRDAPSHPGWQRPPDMTPERAKAAFMEAMLKLIAGNPSHPLAPLIRPAD
jgi:hypothetical protein